MKSILLIIATILCLNNVYAQQNNTKINSQYNSMPSSNIEKEVILSNYDENNIPDKILDWIPWVEKDNLKKDCPDSCIFFPQLKIKENNNIYVFDFKGVSYSDNGWVVLPYSDNDNSFWPLSVLVNGEAAIIVNKDKKPYVKVPKDNVQILIFYNKESLKLQKQITLPFIPISYFNTTNSFINLNKNQLLIGKEFLEKNITNTETIQVFRKLSDNVPLILTTKIKLDYSGSPKIIDLGKVLPEGFKLIKTKSDLKITYKNNNYLAQVSSGTHFIDIDAYSNKNLTDISVKGLINNVDKEIWSIQSNNNIRQLVISGGQQVDSHQVNTPQEWSSYPTWYVDNTLKLKTEKRGINLNSPLDININYRESWYGFNGSVITSIDNIFMKNKDNQFVSSEVGNSSIDFFKINNIPQLLVEKDNKPTLILPTGDLNVKVQHKSSLEKDVPIFLFEGIQSINNWVVNLAPRNRVIGATGSKSVDGAWINSWDLYSLFFLCLLTVATYKLMGKSIAILAFVSIVFFQSNSMFSWSIWIPLLIIMGLLKLIPSKNINFLYITRIIGLLIFAIITISSIPFIAQELRSIVNSSQDSVYFNPMFTTDIFSVIFYLIGFGVIIKAINMISVSGFKNLFQILTLVFVGFLFISTPSLLTSSKGVTFGTGSVNNIPLDSEAIFMAPSSPAPISMAQKSQLNVNSSINKNFSQEVRSVIDEKVQVGAGTPNWSFENKVTIVPEKTAKDIRLYVASPFWVNIAAIIQIFLLIALIYNLAIYLLYVYGKNNWIKKVPPKLINNFLTKEFIKNAKGEKNVS